MLCLSINAGNGLSARGSEPRAAVNWRNTRKLKPMVMFVAECTLRRTSRTHLNGFMKTLLAAAAVVLLSCYSFALLACALSVLLAP